jgi:Na+/H+ antiporter NhaD/arsenite permease-like protein|tara:strand:+ start:10480 stop:11826 length:1347 start_codon:yes stop_codon:yes gene_type:complete
MVLFILFTFILGYVAITIEHSLKIDKLIPALMMMTLCWTGIALGIDDVANWFNPETSVLESLAGVGHEARMHLLEGTLLHHFGKTAEILIFLMGAMAIVEMIDFFEGFGAIKKMIRTRSKTKLLWIISFLAFFLSSIIDNLTATIVLITILRKLMDKPEDRMWYAGFIIIAANAGGAWTPIGDVTTTMLWMAGKVTSVKLIEFLVIPSLITMLVPLLASRFIPAFKGNLSDSIEDENKQENPYARKMLFFGLAMVVFVPIFKTFTHLPPYLGMMFSLSIVALVSEILSNRKISFTNPDSEHNPHHGKGPTMSALAKIEIPSVLFFLGILMTVAAMESIGMIFNFGQTVSATIPQSVFVTILGISSAVIDNVPLVAASIGMFSDAADAKIWHDLAYAAGTGGSILIIGSAAGVVAMGMEKITFFWYLKNITLLALIGYLAGIGFLFMIS